MELDLVVTKAPAVLRPKAHEGTLCPSPHRQHFCCLELLQGVGAAHWKRKKSSADSTFTKQLLCLRCLAYRNQ